MTIRGYILPAKESFEVILQKDSLFLNFPKQKMYLRPYHYDVFNVWTKDNLADNDTSNINGLKLMFRMDESGNITAASMPLEGTAKPIVFTKSVKGNC